MERQPDSGTGNENGGRALVHYAEPVDEMVDATHLGYPAGKMHLTLLLLQL